jgi:hypothetical protein
MNMRTSEAINEISAALAKAQGSIQNPHKEAENPAFKRGNTASTYADLSSGINAIRGALSSNGIAYVQSTRLDGEVLLVDTRLTHTSGQWIESEFPACRFPAKPQDVGSAITYARRYSLFAIVGIAGEDDDGNAANASETPAQKKPIPTPPKPPSDTFDVDTSQVTRAWMEEAISRASTLDELSAWIAQHKPTFGKMMRADFEVVKDAINDREMQLKGKAAA